MRLEKLHSKLGASSCERWSNCPGSVALLDTLPKQRAGKAADEGTAAHNWCEYLLKEGARDAREYIGTRVDARLVNVVMTEELAEPINVYLDHVYSHSDKPGAILHVEAKFCLAEIDAELFGTNDACVYVPSERTLYVDDYKHGVGVVVGARGNKQLRFYAYGAWQKHRSEGIDKIVCSIVQPRAHGEPIKTVTFDELELVDWSMDLAEWVAATRKKDAPLNPGEWCNKTFCGARNGACPALKARADAALAEGFTSAPDAAVMASDELGKRLADLPALKAYVKGIETLAEQEATRGRMPVGFKWVLGRGSRDWTPDKSADEIAKEIQRVSNACNPWEKKLISPPQAEKALGKKVFATLENALVKKRDGKPALAPTSDKRPAWQGDTSGFIEQEELATDD